MDATDRRPRTVQRGGILIARRGTPSERDSAPAAPMWFVRVVGSLLFLFYIVLSIPVAFDVGGRTCGLAYSLSLSTFYTLQSILRLSTPERSRLRWALNQLLGLMQPLLLPMLLIWSLNRFSVDASGSGAWAERTFSRPGTSGTPPRSVQDWLFGHEGVVETMTVGSWDKFLRWSTPVFQLCEGFCSLLVIQAAGQISRWFVNRGRSEVWMNTRLTSYDTQIGMLVMSASVISSSVYFLWRITNFPGIGNLDATLIGVAITCAVFLGASGIGSGKGNPVESSLLFAYVVLCVYQIFTDYLPSSSHATPSAAAAPPPAPAQAAFPPFPPIVMASYTTLLHALSTLPSTIHLTFTFVVAALSTITPSVLISLAYRLVVLYASTRIIPAVRESGARALSQEASLDDRDGAGRLLGLLSWFSPTILIAVYTSLLMQHFASTTSAADLASAWWSSGAGSAAPGSHVWQWINVGATLALYALELYLGEDDPEGGVTGHWKED
ncbi:MAG: hypothetical protein M1826_006502 [Phylliscum demangeonii]|nr:MAG: hypothetical protein M1826_006502 [Phylliscum demangeonii]